MVIFSIFVFIFILFLLVLMHEWGHFKAARFFGIKVDEFGIGFPPKIISKKKGETEYSLNWIPLGGFVKIHGESGEDKDNPRSFISKPVWQRMIVVMAGVFMNFIFAVLILSLSYFFGAPQLFDSDLSGAKSIKNDFLVLRVAEGSPAYNAGIQIGDRVIFVADKNKKEVIKVSNVKEVREAVQNFSGDEILIGIKRDGKLKEILVKPKKEEGRYVIGIFSKDFKVVSYPLHIAFYKGFTDSLKITEAFFVELGKMIKGIFVSGEESQADKMVGPVGIGEIIYKSLLLGFPYLLQIVFLISLNLAIINALPFPALDGGKFAFLLMEGIIGRPIPAKVENFVHALGFALLILLIIFVTFKDISRLISG